MPGVSPPDLSITSANEDEEKRKELLQMYVFVLRCIAYPFNSTHPSDIPRRYIKVTRTNLETIRQRFRSFLNGDTQIVADEAFILSVESYCDIFLSSDRITNLVKSGGCSSHDLRELFRNSIEKRVRCLPDVEGVSRETVISSWLAKYDAIYRGDEDPRRSNARINAANMDLYLSKDHLYDLFQGILDVPKYEHQILYNACQLDNSDEQAAQIRRELDALRHAIENNSLVSHKLPQLEFTKNEMKLRYKEERWNAYKQLKENLEKLPLSKVNPDHKPKKGGHIINASMLMNEDSESTLTKSDTALTFTLEVIIHEVQGISFLQPHKIVYCTMEIEGGEKLRTDAALADKPKWRTQGDFKSNQPLPVLKIKLYTENSSLISLDDKELGRLVLYPNSNWLETPDNYVMTPKHHQSNNDKIKIKIGVKMDKPQGMKKCGYLYCMGQSHWKKWKKRFFVLIQVSQYTFALCSYHTKKSDPQEMIQVDGYTVDYTDSPPAELFHFKGVKEGDWIYFASADENDRQLWIQKLYQATGQTHKPIPHNSVSISLSSGKTTERSRARKHGMEDFVQANPLDFDHNRLFAQLQSLSLEKRLNDNYTSLGWLSPGQKFLLDEFSSRYGVRNCYRHLSYIDELLTYADKGQMIDATLIQYSYMHCISHFKNSGVTITVDEKEMYDDINSKLQTWLTKNITNFWNYYPFGKPDGALKATVQLFEKLKMDDGRKTENQQKEFAAEMKKLMEIAALENYTSLSSYVQASATNGSATDYEKKLEEVLVLAESCRDLLRMTEEYYDDIWSKFPGLLNYHSEVLWSLFSVDMDDAIKAQPEDTWNCFMLFQLLNDYLKSEPNLRNGKFHKHLRVLFAPKVIRYIDLMESSIALSINVNFQKETWIHVEGGNAASEDLLYKLGKLQQFVSYLSWPDEVFGKHLTQRINLMAADMIGSCVKRTSDFFETKLKRKRRNIDYLLPPEICVAINVVVSCLKQLPELCGGEVDGGQHHYHTDINTYLNDTLVMFRNQLIEKLNAAIEAVLSKLSNYDEGTITASLFSWMVSNHKPGDELATNYIKSVGRNLKMLSDKIIYEKFMGPLFCCWYEKILYLINEWLTDRLDVSLHPYQISTISLLMQV
ncbi:uncharacterized protein TRIADDRAFT_23934 [Trichoplax adhaerens]|uniref:PH domain-containing protein n=1 Tax=Trichoplax adhaerens TaxID=10228 RepID=B3RUJ9_TRIAD|nr:hypothetical protein TRIADDRAFT_23934 [Trichoplax adhaerens]EDV25343.1 hypothetical protein TRIADDRAFT_23934 [Trichoplax adhaerens]|eukprot:XP_002111376.1 hypothetical protein TRIADDRAFT_23934 [Trichoplax adhaerens]